VGINFAGMGWNFSAKGDGMLSFFDSAKSKSAEMAAGFMHLADASMGVEAPLEHIVSDNSLMDMEALDEAVAALGNSLSNKLPASAKKGATKLKGSTAAIKLMQRGIAGGFDLMRQGVSTLNQILSVNKLQAFIEAVSLHKLGEIGHQIASLGTQGTNLTTSFEAQAQAASVSTRKIAFGFGFAGKALNKANAEAAGMVMGMKLSEQTATEAVYSMKLASKELNAVGLDSSKTVAMLSDAAGVNAVELATNLKTLRSEFKFTDKDLKGVSSSFAQFGENSGDVKGGLDQIGELMPILRSRALLLKSGFKGIPVEQFARETASAADALFQMTGNAKTARETSFSLAKVLTESADKFSGLFAGTEDDLHQFLYSMSITTGDVNDAFGMMSQGPAGFIKGMGKMVTQVKAKGGSVEDFMKLMRGQMSQAMDPAVADQLISAFDKFDGSMLKSMVSVEKADKSLGKMAKDGWRSSMTLQESFDMMQGSAMARFRQISRAAAVTFVGETGKTFDIFNKKAEALVKEGGPLGMIVEKFSEMHQLGAKALLPQALQPMVAVFGHLYDELIPTVTALGALGFRFGGLLGPLGLVIGAVGLLHAGFLQTQKHLAAQDKTWQTAQKSAEGLQKHLKGLKKGTKDYDETLKKLGQQQNIQKGVEAGYAEQSRKVFAENLTAKIKMVAGAAGKLLAAAPALIKTIGQEFEVLKNQIPWRTLWEGFKAQVAPVGKMLGDLLKKGFDWAVQELKSYFKTWWKNLSGIWGDSSTSFSDKIKETAKDSSGILLGAFALGKFAPIFKVFGVLGDLLGPVTGALETIVELGSGLLGVSSAAFIAGAAIVALIAAFAIWPDEANAAVDSVLSFVHDGLSKAVEWVTTWIIDHFTEIPGMILTLQGRIFKAIIDVFAIPTQLLQTVVDAIIDGIHNALVKKFPELTKTFDRLFATIKTVAHTLILVTSLFTNPFYAMKKAIDFVTNAFGPMKSAGSSTFEAIWAVIKPVWDMLSAIGEFVGTVMVRVWRIFAIVAGGVWELLEKQWTKAVAFFQPIFDTITRIITDAWNKYIKPVWDPIADFFHKILMAVVKIVEDDIALVTGIFTSATKKVNEFFDGVEQKAKDIFGHSINTYVEHDMGKTVEVMQGATDEIQAYLEHALFDSVVRGLTHAFADAFKFIGESTKKFFQTETDQFLKLTMTIYQMFNKMWVEILSETDKSVNDVAATITGAMGNLKQLQNALEQARSAKAALDAGGMAVPGEITKQNAAKSDLGNIYDAVQRPDWWNAAGTGYRDLFTSSMQQLIGAVAGLKSMSSTVALPTAAASGAKTLAARGARNANFMNPLGTADANGGNQTGR
jgi:hypothetical protein